MALYIIVLPINCGCISFFIFRKGTVHKYIWQYCHTKLDGYVPQNLMFFFLILSALLMTISLNATPSPVKMSNLLKGFNAPNRPAGLCHCSVSHNYCYIRVIYISQLRWKWEGHGHCVFGGFLPQFAGYGNAISNSWGNDGQIIVGCLQFQQLSLILFDFENNHMAPQ